MNVGPGLPPPTGSPVVPDDRALLTRPVRQSPIALVFIAVRFVRRLGVSALVAAVFVVFNAGTAFVGLALAILAAAVLLLVSALGWWRFTFVVEGEELVVTRGIVTVQRLVIPLDRIQSVAIDQRLTHRLVGLVRATVDTAGSTSTEFEIDAVDRRIAEALRRLAADTHRPTESAPQVADGVGDRIVARRSWSELVRVGLTTAPWGGLAVLAPLLAFGDEIGQLGGLGAWIDARMDDLGQASDGSAPTFAAALIALAAAVTVFGAALGIVREVMTNWELTITRTPSGLRRTAGLLSTTSRSSTLRRVQIVSTTDNAIQRRLGFTQLRLQVHGDNDLVLPGALPAEVADLRSLVLGVTEPTDLDRGISGAYVFLAVRNTVVIVAAAAIVAWFAVGWWALLTVAAVPVRWLGARERWRRHRWGVAGGRVAVAAGWFGHRSAEAEFVKAQAVTVSQSFFERRRRLATVDLRTADGAITVPLIPLDVARALRDRVLADVETDRRPVL